MKRPPLFLVLLTLALAPLPSCTPPGGGADAKPVIYLYPEAETDVTVTLDYDGELTCAYPVMNGNSWMVTASPDGTLTDAVGQTYNYSTGRASAGRNMTSPRASAYQAGTPPPFGGHPGHSGSEPPGGQRVYCLLAAPWRGTPII